MLWASHTLKLSSSLKTSWLMWSVSTAATAAWEMLKKAQVRPSVIVEKCLEVVWGC